MQAIKTLYLQKKTHSFLKAGGSSLQGQLLLQSVQSYSLQKSKWHAARLYECEARLKEEMDDPHGAIHAISKSLALGYTKKRCQLLAYLLGVKKEDVLGKTHTEAPFLEGLLEASSWSMKKRLHHRLQLIHEYGQASSLDVETYPNFQKAFFHKARVNTAVKPHLENTVNIVIITDDGYAPHAFVVMLSALYHQSPQSH